MSKKAVESSAEILLDLSNKIRVLLVDDESGLVRIAKQCLEMTSALDVDTALSVDEAYSKLEKNKYDVIVSDYQMPGKDGLEFLEQLRESGNKVPFIMFTGKGREEVAIRALNLGANQYLNKVGKAETVYTELAHSITELAKTRKAEEKQCESEEKFRNLFEKANDGLVYVDTSGKILDINEKAAEIAEKRKEDIIGKSFLDLGLVDPRNLPVLLEKLKQQTSDKLTQRFDFEIENKNSEKTPIEISCALIQKNNLSTGFLAIVRDITERKKAEEALKESEERYSRLSAAAFEGIGISERGIIIDVNDQLAEMLGYKPNEMIGKPILEMVAPESRSVVMANLTKKHEGPYEHLTIKKDGTIFPVEVRARSIRYKGHIARVTVIRDISQRKKMEEEIWNAQKKSLLFLTAARASIDGYILTDLDGRITELNNAALTIYEAKDRSEIIGKSSFDLALPEEREKMAQNMSEVMAKGNSSCKDFRAVTRKGAEIFVDYTSTLVRDAKDHPVGFLSIIRNVTERKTAEKVLRESEMRYRSLIEQSHQGILVAQGPAPHAVFVNQAMTDMLGYTAQDFAFPDTVIKMVPSEDRSSFLKVFRDRMEGKEIPLSYECRAVRKDGTTVWLEVSSGIINYNDQRSVQLIFSDISKRKKLEKEALKSQQRFEGLFTGNPEAAAYLEPNFCISRINPRFEELFGYSLEEVKGKHINEVVVQKSAIDEAEILDKKALEGYVYHNTVRLRKDGLLIPVAVSAAPIMFEGKIVGIVAMYKDISDLKYILKRLETMNEKLRVVGGLTRHDARNKLSVVTGNAYLAMKKAAGDDKILEYLKEIETSVQQVVKIFNFAADYEKLGSLELTYIDVGKTIAEASSLFPNLNSIKIENCCQDLTVLADSLLRQLFYNFIDNSLKHGEKTSQIRIYYEKAEDDGLKLTYEDDGVGISPSNKQLLFKEGYSTRSSTGYGLYLIKKMMEVYGWTIQETGESGKGVRFTITIPKLSQSSRENYKITKI